VVTIPSLEGQSVDTYTLKLFNQWGVGKKKKDNGVMLLIAPQDRKVRIEVGYGLEATIPDGRAGRILDEDILPHFKNGNYGLGALTGVQRLAGLILGQEVASPPTTVAVPKTSQALEPASLFTILFLGVFVSIGLFMFGIGIRNIMKRGFFFILWGALFGGIPMLMSMVMGAQFYLILWGTGMALCGFFLGKGKVGKFFTSGRGGSSGGSWGSGGGSSGSFGGGSSGGGGSSRSW
jgi:uncharacterized protein